MKTPKKQPEKRNRLHITWDCSIAVNDGMLASSASSPGRIFLESIAISHLEGESHAIAKCSFCEITEESEKKIQNRGWSERSDYQEFFAVIPGEVIGDDFLLEASKINVNVVERSSMKDIPLTLKVEVGPDGIYQASFALATLVSRYTQSNIWVMSNFRTYITTEYLAPSGAWESFDEYLKENYGAIFN